MPDATPNQPADPVALPEQVPMDDAAGGPTAPSDAAPSDQVPTEDKPEDADSAAHPS